MLPQLKLDLPAATSLLIRFIQDETAKIGVSKAIIGLSGGVDSALVAFLTAQALGPENVLCVMMPYRTSNPDSIADAKRVIEALRVRHEHIDISDTVDRLQESDTGMSQVRKGNLMARVRMILLYDRSHRDGSLVIGTGNKTELLLGYSTHYGDGACAINPIGDLYKSQVWKLSEHLGVPKAIVEKTPSADLWVGQTDEGELGFSYKRVDELLYYMIDERRNLEELLELGFEAHFVTKIRNMVVRNQFKRRPPVIAKVGLRTINADFRYPRDWNV